MTLRLKGTTALGLAACMFAAPAFADMDAAKAFLDSEIGELSTLTRAEQEAELQFFVDAAEPYVGMSINVVSETIGTHEYESTVLAPAFEAITGIKVTHDLIGEGDVVEKLQTQMQSGENIYDAYINDSDLIGTHWRYQQARNLTDWMVGEGAAVTNPNLDLEDFIGLSFTTGPDGKIYQLPDQQFANLYWFRYDWFNDDQNKADFQATYGYELGVPVNWSAYEDIAEFFTGRDLSRLGVEGDVFGNMDYGKKDPSLGWRYTDAWLSMAGAGDIGEPNGLPVDEWGIRVNENSQPVGSCVARGGATNGPAAVYAVTKAIEWLEKYSPPAAAGMTFSEAGPIPAQGNVAQQMFWYTAFTAASVEPDLPVMNEDGTPKWRMAPSPHGAYWTEGTKIGYQDAGASVTDDTDVNIILNTDSTVNSDVLGSYNVVYTATDSAGNSTSETRVVNVVDTTPPSIMLSGNNPDSIVVDNGEVSSSYQDPGATVIDNYDTETPYSVDTALVITSAVGTYTLVYTAIDSSGNEAAPVEREVNVIPAP